MSFPAHLELLQFFLARREDIVDRLEAVLNARRQPIDYQRDRVLLSGLLEDAFFTVPGIAGDGAQLRGQLEEAHRTDGFTPRELPGLHNALIDPAEMAIRAFHLWQQTRWPGRNLRRHYAHTLFNLYALRCLELLTMRLWDAAPAGADGRHVQLQAQLERVWTTSPANQPVLVRDARWLIQLAQSPATDDLGAYFTVGERIAGLPDADRLEVHKAGVRMTAGHLRSQMHYYARKNAVPLDDRSLILGTRNTNALDFALLIQELVTVLGAYDEAARAGDERRRLELAGVICQGISPDPELFLNRLDLLGAYSMIEHLFVTTDPGGRAVHTPMGRRHVGLLQDYAALIDRVASPLAGDCLHFRPAAGAYSPYGVLFGFSTNLIEHIALKALQPETVTPFSLEDVFVEGDAARLAWVSGWRKLPHLTRDVETLFDYPQQFAEDIFSRIAAALRRRASAGAAGAGLPTGRLFVSAAGEPAADSQAAIPDLPVRYIGSSDRALVAAHKAEYWDEARLASERREGRCVLSYRTPGGWVAVSKALLTEVLGEGRDARIAGLPGGAARVLQLMYPTLTAVVETAGDRAGGSAS